MARERQDATALEKIEKLHKERYYIASSFCRGMHVLDAACGVGYGSTILAETARSVVGIDNSKEAISHAIKHFNHSKAIAYDVVDLNKVKGRIGNGGFDAVVSLETIEHLDRSLESTLFLFKNSVKPGGLVIFSHPDNETKMRNHYHKHFNITVDSMLELVNRIGLIKRYEINQRHPNPRHYSYRLYVCQVAE